MKGYICTGDGRCYCRGSGCPDRCFFCGYVPAAEERALPERLRDLASFRPCQCEVSAASRHRIFTLPVTPKRAFVADLDAVRIAREGGDSGEVLYAAPFRVPLLGQRGLLVHFDQSFPYPDLAGWTFLIPPYWKGGDALFDSPAAIWYVAGLAARAILEGEDRISGALGLGLAVRAVEPNEAGTSDILAIETLEGEKARRICLSLAFDVQQLPVVSLQVGDAFEIAHLECRSGEDYFAAASALLQMVSNAKQPGRGLMRAALSSLALVAGRCGASVDTRPWQRGSPLRFP